MTIKEVILQEVKKTNNEELINFIIEDIEKDNNLDSRGFVCLLHSNDISCRRCDNYDLNQPCEVYNRNFLSSECSAGMAKMIHKRVEAVNRMETK